MLTSRYLPRQRGARSVMAGVAWRTASKTVTCTRLPPPRARTRRRQHHQRVDAGHGPRRGDGDQSEERGSFAGARRLAVRAQRGERGGDQRSSRLRGQRAGCEHECYAGAAGEGAWVGWTVGFSRGTQSTRGHATHLLLRSARNAERGARHDRQVRSRARKEPTTRHKWRGCALAHSRTCDSGRSGRARHGAQAPPGPARGWRLRGARQHWGRDGGERTQQQCAGRDHHSARHAGEREPERRGVAAARRRERGRGVRAACVRASESAAATRPASECAQRAWW